MQDAEKMKRQMWSLILLSKYDRLIAHKTWEIQLQMTLLFHLKRGSHCAFVKVKMQTVMQDLQLHLDCHNLCDHMWKTQLKIQFAIPFENSPENPSIGKCYVKCYRFK